MTSQVSYKDSSSSLRGTYVATHTNLILLFKPALYSSALVIKLLKVVVLSQNSYYNTISHVINSTEFITAQTQFSSVSPLFAQDITSVSVSLHMLFL